MKAALRWIAGNLPLMILALVLATLAWVFAAEESDPTRTERYVNELPVVPSGLPEGMVIVGEFGQSVVVTIRAPESVWRRIGANDFSATIDLTGLGAGTHEVPIKVSLREQPSSLTWQPESLTVELAPWAEQSVPVHVPIEGQPALGYLMRAPVAVPRQVTVSGPEPYVTQVVEAATRISVQDARTSVEDEFPLQPLDSAGQIVPYVTLAPATANVRVPIELSGYYSPLTVRVVYEGSPSSGYRITYIAVEPSTVTVRGAPDVIAALPGYIETEPVDVEGAQASIVRQPALEVPPNVAVVSGQPVTVSVFIEAIQSSLTMEITPTLQGLNPIFTATVSPATVEVFLSGPLAQLEALEADDVQVMLDLFDLPRGTHQIEPQVVVPEGLIAQSILPATLQVEIRIPTTPTPSPSATPSPTPTPTED